MLLRRLFSLFFFFNDTATTEIYTLSLHDALPICSQFNPQPAAAAEPSWLGSRAVALAALLLVAGIGVWSLRTLPRSEEHTSELQSLTNLVCRLLLEKKKNKMPVRPISEP